MGDDVLSDRAYHEVYKEVKEKGSATHKGEQRHKEGKGLHELVDPKGYGTIRRSISYLDPSEGGKFILFRGTAMLIENRLDTTGSMGSNVEVAMEALPKTYKLLATGEKPVLGRYDTQIITAIFGDVCDNYVLCRSQAEFDQRIAEQMTLMVPEHGGGDTPEDPQYGLFGGAYLTWATAVELGLKTYDFTITDAPGRHRLSVSTLKRVYGEEVFDRVRENGFQIDEKNLPDTKTVVADLLKRAHAFVLVVGDYRETRDFWTEIYGSERVVFLPDTRLLPDVQAAIIGLTEGVLSMQDLEGYLREYAGTSAENAKLIAKAVANIPAGAQMALPNFGKIPMKGAIYASKTDLWPIDEKTETKKKGKKTDSWL